METSKLAWIVTRTVAIGVAAYALLPGSIATAQATCETCANIGGGGYACTPSPSGFLCAPSGNGCLYYGECGGC